MQEKLNGKGLSSLEKMGERSRKYDQESLLELMHVTVEFLDHAEQETSFLFLISKFRRSTFNPSEKGPSTILAYLSICVR
jgi:hypothetical protein